MKIRFGNCVLCPTESSPTQWDFYVESVVPERDKQGNLNKSAGTIMTSAISYGVRLEFALDEIIHYNLAQDDVETDYLTFLERYKEIRENLNQSIIQQLKQLRNETI